jgi:DUF4097 and DUF4098 domain-containing protein YvlB
MIKGFTATGPLAALVKVPAGSLLVTASGASEVTVAVYPASAGNEADQALAEAAEAELSGSKLTVSAQAGALRRVIGSRRGSVRVEIGLPAGSELEVQTDSSDVDVKGTLAGLVVDSGSGSVQAEDVTGPVTVKTASGTVELGRVDGPLVLNNGSGRLRVAHAAGPVRTDTSSGEVHFGVTEGDVKVKLGSGGLRIGTAHGGSVTASSSSGGLSVGVADGVGVVGRRLKTTSGARRGDLVDVTTSGSGGREIVLDLDTASGDIEVSRAGR